MSLYVCVCVYIYIYISIYLYIYIYIYINTQCNKLFYILYYIITYCTIIRYNMGSSRSPPDKYTYYNTLIAKMIYHTSVTQYSITYYIIK